MKIAVQTEDFDVQAEVAALHASPKVGAVVMFLGTVRDLNEGPEVASMTLEHYPGMTEKALTAIVEEAKKRWDIMDATVIHRVGELFATDQIVFVGVSGAHRGEAFKACEFIIDYLKTEAPFWKKEKVGEGTRWVQAKETKGHKKSKKKEKNPRPSPRTLQNRRIGEQELIPNVSLTKGDSNSYASRSIYNSVPRVARRSTIDGC